MTMTEAQLGNLTCERLKLPHSAALGFQTYIGSALNNLALDVVNDAQKRHWLITDPNTVTVSVTSSNGQYYADLTTVLASATGVMIDYLNYGTIYITAPTKTWTSANVDDGVDSPSIAITGHGYAAGTAVRLTTVGTLPAPSALATTYYLAIIDANHVCFSTTYNNAITATNTQDFTASSGYVVQFTTLGSGTSTMTPYGAQSVLQWLTSPNQGGLTSAVPIAYPTGWLVDTNLYLNNVTGGTLSFAVPFVPTLATLPTFLENDAIDAMVDLALAGGQELPKAAAEK